MPRILFVVNEHPNEAFAISVARETAKLLRAKGLEVVLKKIPLKQTLLGQALKNDAAFKIYSGSFGWEHRARTIQGWIRQENPGFVYMFHCTPAGHEWWAKRNLNRDFTIEAKPALTDITFKKPSFIIEIKAQYTEFPKLVLKKIKDWAGKDVADPSLRGYLTTTTSQQLSRKAGLTPEKFGKAIANAIGTHVEQQRKLQMLQNISGRVLRKPKKSGFKPRKKI